MDGLNLSTQAIRKVDVGGANPEKLSKNEDQKQKVAPGNETPTTPKTTNEKKEEFQAAKKEVDNQLKAKDNNPVAQFLGL